MNAVQPPIPNSALDHQMVMYYSDFELNVNQWIKDYNFVSELKSTIYDTLGQQWMVSWRANLILGSAFKPIKTSYKCPLQIITEVFFLDTMSTTTVEQFIESVQSRLHENHYTINDKTAFNILIIQYFEISGKMQLSFKAKHEEESNYLKGLKRPINPCSLHLSCLPGFTLFKNRIISPMIAASKMAIEALIPKREKIKNEIKKFSKKIYDNIIGKLKTMAKASHEGEGERSPKRKCIEKSYKMPELDCEAMAKLSLCVDEQLEAKKILYHQIIQDLAVIILHIDKSTLVSGESIFTVYKPAKELYYLLMRILFYAGFKNVLQLSSQEVVDLVKRKLRQIWKVELEKPCKKFYEIVLSELKQEFGTSLWDDHLSVYKLFEKIKSEMLHIWNKQIIEKSQKLL